MSRIGVFTIAILLFLLPTLPATAQLRPLFLNASHYQELGLEAVWSTQLEMEAGRSELAAVAIQIVGLDSYESLQANLQQVFEVSYDPHRMVRYAENDVDRDGQQLGRAEAQRLAEKQMIILEAEGRNPKLVIKNVPPIVMYVHTTAGTLQALDAETGKTLWTRFLGRPGEPAYKPGANDQFVVVVRGSKMYVLERVNGELIYSRDLDHNPIFGPVLSATHAFVTGMNGMVQGYQLPDAESDHRAVSAWVYQSGSRVTTRPLVTDSTISWGTQNGLLFVASIDGPKVLYRHIMGGPVYDSTTFVPPNQLVVGSSDGTVSSLEQLDGMQRWVFSTGDEINQAPIAHREQVYLVTNRQELFSVNAETGVEQWSMLGIDDVIAVGANHIYGRDKSQGLTAIDRKTGRRLGTLPTSAYERAVTNLLTDRIYLVSESGSLLCLRELDVADPVVQVSFPQPPEESKSRQRRGDAQADEPVEQRADGENVFGDETFDDDAFMDDETDAVPDEAPTDEPADDDAFNFGENVFGDETSDDPAAEVPADETDDAADETADETDNADDNPFDF